jgi:hypothetical protein
MTEEATVSPPQFHASFEVPGIVTVGWYSPKEIVHVQWQAAANSADLRAAVDAGLVTLSENRGTRWCADCRDLGPISADDQAWLDGDWFPRALAAGVERMAIVLPHQPLANVTVVDVMDRVPATRMERAYFTTVWQAGEWLTPPATGAVATGQEA